MMLVSFLPLWDEATTARYWMTFLVFSVFPAPDSPLQDMGTVISPLERTLQGFYGSLSAALRHLPHGKTEALREEVTPLVKSGLDLKSWSNISISSS